MIMLIMEQNQRKLRKGSCYQQSMANIASSSSASLSFLMLVFVFNGAAMETSASPQCQPIKANDTDLIHFALNLEFLEAEFFLYGALGKGLDYIAPSLALGGPPPIGPKKANLNPLVHHIIETFGYQEVGHIRAIMTSVGGFPRPLMDLSSENFGKIIEEAMGYKVIPPWDPYANTINYLIASYMVPYLGLVGYVGAAPHLTNPHSRRLVASLLGPEAGQDGVIRTLLNEIADEMVHPYNLTVADFTNLISSLFNQLARCGIKDEGLVVPLWLGAENRTESNILSADANSLSYARTPPEILRTVYGSGDEHVPGGFYPHGANGNIAKHFLV